MSIITFQFDLRLDDDQLALIVAVIGGVSESILKLKPPPSGTFTVFNPTTLQTFGGVNLKMNLKNTQQVRATASFKNRLGGPAQIQPGSATVEAISPTGAFTAEQNPDNELEVLIKANPQAAGTDQDVGIVRLTVDGDAGDGVKPLVAELAVNVIAGDADTIELSPGEVTEQ